MNKFTLPSDIAEIAAGLENEAESFSGKRVLISGGQGFLGRYFCSIFAHMNDHMLDEPCQVVALDNLITGRPLDDDIASRPDIHIVDHDVIQPYKSDDKVDFIIHAAGIASPFHYRAHPLETLQVAITGTQHLMETARDHGARLVFMSSSEIYGDPDPKHVPTPESYRGNVSSQGPRACYDESKRVGETLCYIFHEHFGVHTNAIRPFNVYGPGMQPTDYRVLPNFAARIVSGERLQVYGTGNQTRTYCYVTDAMIGFTKVVARGVPGEVYNIGNPKPEISVLELVEHIETALGRSVDHDVIEHPDSYPADEPMRRCPDIRKAREQLAYTPEVDLASGLKRFLDWAQQSYPDAA